MKSRLLIILFFAFIAVFAQGQLSSDSSSIEGKVRALENAWEQAEKVSDSKALHDLLDDSLI